MAFINLYSILDVENFASVKAVTKAFRKKALTAHPDRNKSADPAEFHKLLEAYEELKDPGKKALHDSRLRILSSVTASGGSRRRSLFSDVYFSFTPRPRAAPPPEQRREYFGYRQSWFADTDWSDLRFNRRTDQAFNGRRNGWTYQSEAWGRDGLSSSGAEAETDLNRRRNSRRRRPFRTTSFSPYTRRKRNRSTSEYSTLHNLIVSYGVYKRILDRICRRKRINNYMVMPEMVRRTKTEMEISQYYKIRLYHYTNKSFTRQKLEDEYIKTYKVGKKKQDLDKLVTKGMKIFSII